MNIKKILKGITPVALGLSASVFSFIPMYSNDIDNNEIYNNPIERSYQTDSNEYGTYTDENNFFNEYEFKFESDSGINVTVSVLDETDSEKKDMIKKYVSDVYNKFINSGYTLPQNFNLWINSDDGAWYSLHENKIRFDYKYMDSEESFNGMLMHEITHMAQPKDMPSWLVEGHAEFNAYNGCLESNDLHPPDIFSSQLSTKHDNKVFNYTSGCLAVKNLIENGVIMSDLYKEIIEDSALQVLTKKGFNIREIEKSVDEKIVSNMLKNDVKRIDYKNITSSNKTLIEKTFQYDNHIYKYKWHYKDRKLLSSTIRYEGLMKL